MVRHFHNKKQQKMMAACLNYLFWCTLILTYVYFVVRLFWRTFILPYVSFDVRLFWYTLILPYVHFDVRLFWRTLILTYTYFDIRLFWHTLILTYDFQFSKSEVVQPKYSVLHRFNIKWFNTHASLNLMSDHEWKMCDRGTKWPDILSERSLSSMFITMAVQPSIFTSFAFPVFSLALKSFWIHTKKASD